MGYLTLKTGFSFGKCYGFLERLINEYSDDGFIGFCDIENTFMVHRVREICNKHNDSIKDHRDYKTTNPYQQGSRKSKAKKIKPIFGIRINVCKDATKKVKPRGQFGTEYIIIAKNKSGLREVFKLTAINSENFYYRGNVSAKDIDELSNNVFVIPTSNIITSRVDYYGLTFFNRDSYSNYLKRFNTEIPLVVVDDNFYPTKNDKAVYELMSGRNRDLRTHPQHILSIEEKYYYFPKESVDNIKIIADKCEDYQLDRAHSVNSIKGENIEELIIEGAKKKGIDLSKEPYRSRVKHELKVVKDKEFDEYFLVVGDIIRWAKERTLVAPGRGSSAGSLICYCLDITDVDPIKYNLIFSRFIDPNRYGMPDIDSDFADSKRDNVVKYIISTYGKDKVKTISNITTYKPKSAIGEFAKELRIPEWEVQAVKDSIIERAGGDNRASFCIADTFKETDHGKQLLEDHPEIALVEMIEGHPKNKGKHAAGVIICNEPLTDYCGIDNRDDTVLLNKDDAEQLNLLKVDILGLRTLSVLESTAKLCGFDFKDFYNIDLEEEDVYDIFHEERLSGIFQYEGSTMRALNKEAPMDCFEDIACAQALARPGALSSGGTAKYIAIKNGRREPVYYCQKHKELTENTFGITVFQETMMTISREISGFSWKDVSTLRRAASKSYGDEFFSQFKEPFVKGCMETSNLDKETAEALWKDVASSGSYSFNRSHAVSYGIISFWTAWCKKHHSLEFIASILNHSKTDKDSLKTLREFYENDGLEYEDVNPDTSALEWSIQEGKLVGGLKNINGFGVRKARQAIKMRDGEIPFTNAILNTMFDPKTPYQILFPCDFNWYYIYENPYEYTGEKTKISYIKDVQEKGTYWIIGQVIYFDDINLNDFVHIEKRGSEIKDGFDKKITFKIEDDTDSISISVSRFDYNAIAPIVLNTKVDHTWLLVKGEIIFDNARVFMAKKVANLNEQLELQPYDKDFSKIKRYKG